MFGPVASDPTAWRVLDAIDTAALARLRAARAAARELTWLQLAETRRSLPVTTVLGRALPGFVLDIDATSSWQQSRDCSPRFVPNALETPAATHPDIRIDVRAAGSQDVSAAVADGSAQLGFVFGPPARSDVVVLKALPLPLSVMVQPDDPLAAVKQCSLRDLEGRAVALPTPDFGIRQELDRACAESGTHLKVNYETNSLALLREIAVRTGAAIFMTVEDTAVELASGALISVPLADRRPRNTRITLVKGLAAYPSPAPKVVSDALLTAMSE